MDLNEVASQLSKKAVASRTMGGVVKAGEYAAWAKECKAIAEEHYKSLEAEKKAFIQPVTNFLSNAYGQASDTLKNYVSDPLAHRALMGAGLGAGGGALLGLGSNLVSGRKKKNYLSDMLHYGLLGGLGGGAAGGLYELATNPKAIEGLAGGPAVAEKPPEAKEEKKPTQESKQESKPAPEAAAPAPAAAAVPPTAPAQSAAAAAVKKEIEDAGKLGPKDLITPAGGYIGGHLAGATVGAGKDIAEGLRKSEALVGRKAIPLAETKGFQEAFLNSVKDIQAKAVGSGTPLMSGQPIVTNYQQARDVAKHIIQNPGAYGITGDPIEKIMQFEKAKNIDPKSVLGALGHDTNIAKSLQKVLEIGDTATRLKALENLTKIDPRGNLPKVDIHESLLTPEQAALKKIKGTPSEIKSYIGGPKTKAYRGIGGKLGLLAGTGMVLKDIFYGKNTPTQNGKIVGDYVQSVIKQNPNMSMNTFKTLQDFASTAAKGVTPLEAKSIIDQIGNLDK